MTDDKGDLEPGGGVRPGATPPAEDSTAWVSDDPTTKVPRHVWTGPHARTVLIVAAVVAAVIIVAVAIAVGLNYANDVS